MPVYQGMRMLILLEKKIISIYNATESEWIKGMCEGEKPFLGVLIDEDDFVDKKGLMVREIVPGSTVEEAGMQSGDLLLSIDGYIVNFVADIRELLEDIENNE